MLRKHMYKLIVACIAVMLVASGCSKDKGNSGNVDSSKGNDVTNSIVDGTVMKSSTEDVQITLPKGWKKDDELNAQAKIGASDRLKEKYVMVNSVSKKDMSDDASLDDYIAAFMSSTKVSLENMKEFDSKDIKVDSLTSKVVEFSGEAQKVKVHYLGAFVEKGDYFHQIITWSTESKFNGNKNEFMQVIESFKVLKEEIETQGDVAISVPDETTEATNDAANNLVVMTDADNNLEISLPKGFKEEIVLSEDADIQASNMAKEDYFILLSELKEDFGADISLKEYYDLISDNMVGAVQNPQQTEPQEVSINGNRGLQYELTGEIDSIKIAYIITLVESDDRFSQLIFWTVQSMMDKKRDVYQQSTNTFKTL